MNKFWIFLSVLVILTVALSACGGQVSGGGEGSGGGEIQLPGGDENDGGGIQLPGTEGNEGEGSAVSDNTLIYVLIGAIVLVALVALAGKR
jgi:hypothetical protein